MPEFSYIKNKPLKRRLVKAMQLTDISMSL